MKKFALLLVLAHVFSVFVVVAQPTIQYTQVDKKYSNPVDIKNAGDGSGKLYIVEQLGKIRIAKPTGANPWGGNEPVFIDLKDEIGTNGNERGLLGLAFDPGYASNRYFFVYYTNKQGDVTVARYRRNKNNADSADLSSKKVLLSLPKPGGFSNHNGGGIQFGPDGYLYITIGDGGSGGDPFNNAQDGNSLFGKMLRLDVSQRKPAPYYAIPADNPFVNDPNVRDEIWALGLRNAWRWSFDRQNDNLWIADVGQDKWEEINVVASNQSAGANYGWRCYEGEKPYNTSGCAAQSSYLSPIFTYKHSSATGGYSVTGGYVYRGNDYPALQGYYVCSDYVSNNIWVINPDGLGGWDVDMQTGAPNGISTYGETEEGELYAAALSGEIYRVSAGGALNAAKNTVAENNIIASSVYPSLVQNGVLHISVNDKVDFIKIFDMQGRLVLQQKINIDKGNMQINVSNIHNGTYVVQLVGKNSTQQKIIISR